MTMPKKTKIKCAVQVLLLLYTTVSGFWSTYFFIWSKLGLSNELVVSLILAIASTCALYTSIWRN